MTAVSIPAGAPSPSRARAFLAHVTFSAQTAAEAVGHNKLVVLEMKG